MTDKTHRIPLTAWLTLKWAELRARVRASKTKADDNIERSEPETLLASAFGFVIALILTAAFMMLIYSIMSGSMAGWIGEFIASQDNALTFDERLAGFAAAIFALISLIVTFGIELGRNASHDDIVDVVNDLGEQIDERFAELEERVAQSLASVEKEIEDLDLEARLNPERN